MKKLELNIQQKVKNTKRKPGFSDRRSMSTSSIGNYTLLEEEEKEEKKESPHNINWK